MPRQSGRKWGVESFTMSNQFDGRKLLVVGGTSGMGLETARMVLAQGGSAVIVGHRPEKTEEARQELALLGPVTALTADLASADELARLLRTLDELEAEADALRRESDCLPKGNLEALRLHLEMIKVLADAINQRLDSHTSFAAPH